MGIGAADPTTQWRDGLGYGPSPYLRWAIVEEVYEHDVEQPSFPDTGGQENFLAFARSVKVRWLHHAAGRSVVRFLEPWGVTSMPMVGSVVAVGFIGGPGGEPVILGFWTQGYNERIPGEIGSLRPGQEVWRRSGLRFRIVPRYTDLRKFAEQLNTSPWDIDLIFGEQHDTACFCPKCQTRFPSIESTEDGKTVLSCASECPICGGKLRLVSGSVAAGEGDAWLHVQATYTVDSILNGVFNHIDENVLGENIDNVQTQQAIRNALRRYIFADVRAAWGGDVTEYYETELVSRWESILREYFTVGSLLNNANDASEVIDSTLVTYLITYIDSWIQTQLQYYLTDTDMSVEDKNTLTRAMRDNLTSYVTDLVPSLIETRARAFVETKARIYITEVVAQLRRKAIDWLYKDVLKKLRDKALKEIGGRLKIDFGGLRAARDAVANYSAEILGKIAQADLFDTMQKFLDEGIQDPEELPVLELRLNQDLRSVINAQTGFEEGQGQKASRCRLKLYRTGEMHLQIRDDIFLELNADGSVDLRMSGPLSIDAQQATVNLEEDSLINIDGVLRIGHPGKSHKAVTLDDDDIREYEPGAVGGVASALTGGLIGGISTRQFIERVAWRYVADVLKPIFDAAVIVPTDGGASLKVSVSTALGLVGNAIPNPPANSVIGKADASADHLEGN